MSIAIAARNVSKSYMIRHEQREPYVTVRDVLAAGAKDLMRRTRGVLRGSQRPELASREEFWALKSIDMEVSDGERVAIIGRNGAGKSTLLKILSRITEPTTGEIRIHGRVASLLEVGTGFHPELTGRENIFLNAAVLGMTRREVHRRFDEIVAFAEVERFLDTPVKHYSSGMYMRLAFSVAAHLEPEILIVDEVLSVGDAQFQKKCLGRMEHTAKEGRTVLFVSHNLQTVLSLCNRGILLDQGRVAASGSVQDVVAAYRELGTSNQIERTWNAAEQAPGNDFIKLRSARLRLASGSAANQLTIRTPFSVEVVYDIGARADAFYLGVSLRSVYGEIVFASGSPPMPIGPGTYRSECFVPGDLLNDGVYVVDVGFVRDAAIPLFRAEDLLTFEVHDVERAAGGWLGRIPGAVRPKLRWETETVSSYVTA
jgi:lipopolysaccharide transport system ATP-binding protein